MWWRRKRERELERELRAHLELEADELNDFHAARRALGNSALIKESVREAWGWTWLERLWQDLRYSGRVLRKSPGFTAVAVVSLTLGIGANTALFSLVDAVMLKSLPVRDPQQLRILTWVRSEKEDSKEPVHSHSGYNSRDEAGNLISGSFSYPAYELLRDHLPQSPWSGHATPYQSADLVAFSENQFTVMARGASEFSNGQFVSGNYFEGLGVRPIAGRSIVPDDDSPSKPMVAVLSYRYWEKRFGLDPGVLGQEISVNQTPATVVGIMPPAFQGVYPGLEVDLFVPMAAVARVGPRWFSQTDPYNWWVQIFGRLRPGVTERAAAETVRAALASEIASYAGPSFQAPEVRLAPGSRGVGMLSNYGSSRLYVLDAIVGIVLLIACVNLAQLLLARSTARRREIAVRLSIGASRSRVIRQLLTESFVLAGAGGALGLIVAKPFLELLLPTVFGFRGSATTLDARLDARALGFTFAIAILTAVLSGLLPAWRSTRVDLGPSLKGGGSAGSGVGSRQYVSHLLIAGQVALSVLLLAGAGLFMRTFIGLMTVDLGFETGNVLTFQTDASRGGYQGQRLLDLYARLRGKIESIPGVVSVGLSQTGLIQGSESSTDFNIPSRPGQRLHAYVLECSDSFLQTMRIPVVLGRGIAGTDGSGSPRVAVINEALVKRYFAGANPLGQRIEDAGVSSEIVGVVKDAHYDSVRNRVPPTAYFSYAQDLKSLGRMSFAIRTALPPLALAESVRRTVSEVDPAIPVAGMRTMEQQIEQSVGPEHLMAKLASAFGLAAALLAAIGLYGVMAYAVARRTSEIGIRMALGAKGRNVSWLVVRESVWMVAAGLAVGVPSALGLSRFVRSMLYGIAPNDPWSFVFAVLLMSAVGAAAAWMPAYRAARVDPMVALRNE